MELNEENLVMGPVARAELGKPGKPISNSRFSAIKRAMGLTGRYVLVSEMRAWLRENQNFSEREIYPRNRKPQKAKR
jgi:hypothetical protein